MLLGLVEDLLVQFQLHQRIEEIVLLGAHVHAVENAQDLALRTLSPGLSSRNSVWPLLGSDPGLGDLDHAGRGEPSADAGEPRGIEAPSSRGARAAASWSAALATATESLWPLRIPKALPTSSGTSSV